MIKKLQDLKGSGKSENLFDRDYKIVQNKIRQGLQPNLAELRRWFIYKMEQEYKTTMLGTNWAYCNKTFNALKTKYNLDNLQLALKIEMWHKSYRAEYTETFDFSKLNTNWLIEKLNAAPSYQVKDDEYRPDTTNRRI